MNFARFVRCYIQSIAEDELGLRAGALSYFGTFSMFPLFLLLFSVFGRFLADNAAIEAYIFVDIYDLLPEGAEYLLDIVEGLTENWGGVSIIAIIGLLWAASGFFRGLESTINRVFGAEQLRPTLLSRGIGMLMAILVGPLIFLAVILSSISQVLLRTSILPENIQNILSSSTNTLVLLLILALAFFLVYYLIPGKRPKLRPAIGGALIAALVWALVTRIYIWYVSSGITDYSVVYGSLSIIIVTILWFYLSNFVILLGAEMVAYLGRTKTCDPIPMAEPVEKVLARIKLSVHDAKPDQEIRHES